MATHDGQIYGVDYSEGDTVDTTGWDWPQKHNALKNGVIAPQSSGGSLALDDLIDVVIGPPESGDVLRYDGENWVNQHLVPHKDAFTVTSNFKRTYWLNFLPVQESLNLSLNGIQLQEIIDYTVDSSTGEISLDDAVVTVAGAVPDIFTADYWTTAVPTSPPPAPTPAFVAAHDWSAPWASANPAAPTELDLSTLAVQPGDLIVVAINAAAGGDVVTTPAGWTLHGPAQVGFTNVSVFTKMSDGTETAFPLSDTAGSNCAALAVTYRSVGNKVSVIADADAALATSSSTWDQPQVAVVVGQRVVHVTADQTGGSGATLDTMGADVTERIDGEDQGTVKMAIGDFVATANGLSTVETAATSASMQYWAGVTLAIEGVSW